MICLYN